MHDPIFNALNVQRKKLANPNEIYQLFADHGYISIFANYRKAPFVSYYGMREDMNLCLKKIQEMKVQRKIIRN